MGLLDRVSAARTGVSRDETRFGVDSWINDYLMPSLYQTSGVTQTMVGDRVRQVSTSLPGYTQAVRDCPPAFAAQMVRALVLSQVRFTFRNLPSTPTPRRLFGTNDLQILERPWRGGTTGSMVAQMEWHEGLAGNSFLYRQAPDQLRILRPDFTALVYGSQQEPELAATALDGDLLGYAYCNGGFGSGHAMTVLLPDEVCHWAPLPDPLTNGDGLGMSWITAAIRDIQGDVAATEHKLRFWSNAATPNMVVKGIPAGNQQEFDEIVDMLEARHRGLGNAYRTLYLTAGADATVVGSNFKDMDLKAVQGAGETRVAMLGRVPAPLLGISEGLAGSSLNAGNFGMARRIFADSWVYPTLQDLSAALETIVPAPPNPRTGSDDSELWFDTTDMPILREDAKDAAEIEQIKAATIEMHIRSGFTPESSVAAVLGQDQALLKHTGLQSVQMQAAAPDMGLAQVLYTKAQATDVLVKAGYKPESVVAALDAYDLNLLVAGDLVPRQLIEDPAIAGAEPGVQAIPAGPGSKAK
jgi:phage portal protein BeeE